MTNRFARDVEALEVLLTLTEKRFLLPEGTLRSDARHQPVVSYRNLYCHMAREAGYSYPLIADVLYHDHTSVRCARNRADNSISSGHRWWAENRDALQQAWGEALG